MDKIKQNSLRKKGINFKGYKKFFFEVLLYILMRHGLLMKRKKTFLEAFELCRNKEYNKYH